MNAVVDSVVSLFDDVRRAKHYNSHPSGVEAIEVIRYMSGNMFNAFKYVYRAGLKDTKDTKKDLEKALYYLNDELVWLPSPPMGFHAIQYTRGLMDKIAEADKGSRGMALRAIYTAAVGGNNGVLITFAIERVTGFKNSLQA